MRGVSFFRKRKAAKEYDIRIKAAAGRLLFRPVFESLYLDGEVYVLSDLKSHPPGTDLGHIYWLEFCGRRYDLLPILESAHG
jgi:hypothetical protein